MFISKPRLALLAVFAISAAAGAALLRGRFLPTAESLPGLRVDGVPLDSGEGLRSVVAARAAAVLARRVTLVVEREPGEPRQVLAEGSLASFGVVVDVDAVVDRARRLGHEGDLLERAELAERARRDDLDVPLVPGVDERVALARLVALKEIADVPPVSARLDLEHHDVVRERDGRYLDAHGAIANLARAARDLAVREIVVPATAIPPRVTSDFIKSLDIREALGSFETYFSRRGDQARRATNIDVAAKKLDGVVIMPGELFSFNAVVGERSEDNGFQKSWEILKGEMIEGVGGGTCQVASTFHAAAFFGGLEVLERLPHSRPSAYIPMGLDSTVVYPAVDLKIRNPHPFPVVIHAKVTGAVVKIELLGASRPVRVAFKRELVETRPYRRKIFEDDTLRGSRVVLKQHGIRGFTIKRSRELFYPDGTKRVEEVTDKYPATYEIYEVPPGFDEALLPPLPEPEPEPEVDTNAEPPAAAAAIAGAIPGAVAVAPSPPAVACAGDCPPDGTPASSIVNAALTNAPLAAVPAVASAPTSPPSPPSAIAELRREAASRGLELVEAPGAHSPTAAQAKPAKEILIRR